LLILKQTTALSLSLLLILVLHKEIQLLIITMLTMMVFLRKFSLIQELQINITIISSNLLDRPGLEMLHMLTSLLIMVQNTGMMNW